jgi:hypothetical protein
MFTAFLSNFKAEPKPDLELLQANEALRERMNYMLRHPYVAPRVSTTESNSRVPVNKAISIRKTIAA